MGVRDMVISPVTTYSTTDTTASIASDWSTTCNTIDTSFDDDDDDNSSFKPLDSYHPLELATVFSSPFMQHDTEYASEHVTEMDHVSMKCR